MLVKNIQRRKGTHKNDYNAEITKSSIRIFGKQVEGWLEPIPFDITFQYGTKAEYNSYNLSYLAPIVKATAKSVIFEITGSLHDTKRLSLYEFCWRNWNFDLEKTLKSNSDMLWTL